MNPKLTVAATFGGGLILLLAGLAMSISFGASDIHPSTILSSIFAFDETSKAHLIIRTLRAPRALVAALVGASMAVAGALMQAIMRNPLASPQVFGVNAGASLAMVSSIVFFPALPPAASIYFAFAGAAAGGWIVYSISSTGGGITPARLAVTGMAVHFFLSSITQGIILFSATTTQQLLYWLAGAVDGRVWSHVALISPWTAVGLIGAMILARSMTILGLGEEVARGLGQKIELARAAAGVLVIVLAGSSVAVAGPIGFIGLMIPHIVRKLVGVDYRLVIPGSALLGAALLVNADILARFIAFPFESPVGIVTALMGAPFFIYLARKKGRKSS